MSKTRMKRKRVQKVEVTCSWEEVFEGFSFFKQAQGLSETTIKDYEGYATRFFNRFCDAWQSPNLKKYVMEYMA